MTYKYHYYPVLTLLTHCKPLSKLVSELNALIIKVINHKEVNVMAVTVPEQTTTEDEWISAEELAKLWDCGADHVRDLMRAEKIPGGLIIPSLGHTGRKPRYKIHYPTLLAATHSGTEA